MVPLGTPPVVTIAVKLPARGLVEKVTVRDVAVAEVTAPIAPLLNVTKLFAAVVLKFVPAMVTEATSAACVDEVLAVTVGAVTVATTVATCTAVPLETLFDVTTAVKLPVTVGLFASVMVSEVEEAAETAPVAPPLSATVLAVLIELNPKPLITSLVPLTPRLDVLLVTTGEIAAT